MSSAPLALALNLWRAIGFASLLLRGAQLLNLDVRDRRRDLDSRVDAAQSAGRGALSGGRRRGKRAEAAARRAGGKAQTRAPGPDFLDARHSPASRRAASSQRLARRMGQSRSGGAPRAADLRRSTISTPCRQRRRSPGSTRRRAQSARLGRRPGARSGAPLSARSAARAEARRRFEKWLQVVVNLPDRAGLDGERLVARLLATDGQPTSPAPDPAIASALAEPLVERRERAADRARAARRNSPRAAKRFLNAYRLARCSTAPRPRSR